MEAINKKIPYYDLFLSYNIQNTLDDTLPSGFSYCSYQTGDEIEWARIETSAQEFENEVDALNKFRQSFQSEYHQLSSMLFFIQNEKKEKVATGMAYHHEDGGKVHWIAIQKEYQGYHLSKPLISHVLNCMKEKGYTHTILHTQTINWLATKIYLNMGFKPINIESEGWKIIQELEEKSCQQKQKY